jgi:hypothetical protein
MRMTKAEKAKLAAEREARYEEQRAIVRTGKCPLCGGAIKRNNSMTGWYLCEQLGAECFRKDPTKPSCSWQTFTE